MLTIGQMSKACAVSVKTLRHYEKIGLLRPQMTDGQNGYRYYDEEQIATMLLIGRLKRYGFSLADIQTLLETEDGDGLRRQLARQRFRLQREMEHILLTMREMERHLENFERTGDIMSYQNQYQIRVTECEEQALMTVRARMSVEDFGVYYSKVFERVARGRLTPNGIVLAIYHDETFDPADNDTELGAGICEKEQADLVLPRRLCATTVHKGPYTGLPDAYGAVTAWMHANGYQMDGAPYEIYRKDFRHGLQAEEWETEIFFPVKK